MNKFPCLFFLIVLFLLTSCRNAAKNEVKVNGPAASLNTDIRQDTNLLYLDSMQILYFIGQDMLRKNHQKNLESFYKKRNGAYAWINHSGINEYAGNFINLLNHEDISNRNDTLPDLKKLHVLFSLLSADGLLFNPKDTLISELELLLTINFFEYAKRNWRGISDEEIKNVNWFMERKILNYEDLLDTILKKDPYLISTYEPVYRQYGMLKKYLKKYYDIENEGGWAAWPDSVTRFKKGDASSLIPLIKRQLYLLEDLKTNDSTDLFDNELSEAVKNFQKRHGLMQDGIIEGKTINALRIPVHERIQQILINLERSKWLPVEQKGDYLAVNIPDFKLLVYHNDTLQWSCNVIVGKAIVANNTIIFNDFLEYVVFCPYWNIPKSILIKETLPEIKKNPNYLVNHDLEIVDSKGQAVAASSISWNNYTDNFPYIIRQRPGKNNALGLVKFLFPNAYDIYLHDTPEKSLFGETIRTFSHGCIRLEEPEKLAVFLLRNDSSWTTEEINATMEAGIQTFVRLNNKVPVFVTYFTAWVGSNGKLNFREDVYHHDAKMKQILFSGE